MSSFTIFIIASVARFVRAGSRSCIISSNAPGTICQRTPKRSMSHPHACAAPSLEQRIPVPVELRLIVARDDEGYRVVELVMRPGAHGAKRLPEQSEIDHLY